MNQTPPLLLAAESPRHSIVTRRLSGQERTYAIGLHLFGHAEKVDCRMDPIGDLAYMPL